MEILGFHPIQLALIITISGVIIRTYFGMQGKSIRDLDPNLLARTLIVGCLVSLPIVATTIDGMHPDIDEIQQLITLSVLFGAVLGIDGLAKRVLPKTKKQKVTEFSSLQSLDKPSFKFTEQDDESDLLNTVTMKEATPEESEQSTEIDPEK